MVLFSVHWLIFGGIPLVADDGIQTPRHGLTDFLQVLDVLHLQHPELSNFPLKFLSAGRLGVSQLRLYPGPDIVNGVQSSTAALLLSPDKNLLLSLPLSIFE